MIQLVDIISGRNKNDRTNNILKMGDRVSFQLGDTKVSGNISCLDIKCTQERRLYSSPIVDISMSLTDIVFEESS